MFLLAAGNGMDWSDFRVLAGIAFAVLYGLGHLATVAKKRQEEREAQRRREERARAGGGAAARSLPDPAARPSAQSAPPRPAPFPAPRSNRTQGPPPVPNLPRTREQNTSRSSPEPRPVQQQRPTSPARQTPAAAPRAPQPIGRIPKTTPARESTDHARIQHRIKPPPSSGLTSQDDVVDLDPREVSLVTQGVERRAGVLESSAKNAHWAARIAIAARSPQTARTAIVFAEILNPPVALRENHL